MMTHPGTMQGDLSLNPMVFKIFVFYLGGNESQFGNVSTISN